VIFFRHSSGTWLRDTVIARIYAHPDFRCWHIFTVFTGREKSPLAGQYRRFTGNSPLLGAFRTVFHPARYDRK
jgi:hypothetical protein